MSIQYFIFPGQSNGRLRRTDSVISLPSHFKVDDPENSGFGRRLRNKNFETDQIIQASTLEEVRASRVRKRIFSTSVISERTIQLKDEDDTNNFRNRGPEKSTRGPFAQTTPSGLGSSRAIIKYVSTVPPAPFGTRTSPTETSDKKKVTIRTVIRRPPTRTNKNENESVVNTTVQPSRSRSRVRIKDSLLARVQGRLRARSTTPEPLRTTTETITSVRTITAKEPVTELVETTEELVVPITTTRFESVESTERIVVPETTEIEQEEVRETTLDPEVGTTEPPEILEIEEEEVITETSVAMSIGESEAHKVVMTTIKSEETTLDNLDTTEPIKIEEELTEEDVTSRTPTPAEGLLGSSLERPDGLQKELLVAIRRKISKTRESQNNLKPPKNVSSEDIQVSPASNSVGSTQHPPFFRPIPFPNSNQDRTNPRVRIFLRVPDEKPGSNPVKIPNFSHIQGKLARLNAAISEGLRNDLKNKSLTSVRPRIGAYTSTTTTTTTTTTKRTTTTTTTTTTSTTTTTTTTEAITELQEVVPVAGKTYTYLDILRQRYKEGPSSTTTTTTTTSTTSTTTTTTSTTTTTTVKLVEKDHPTSHFRPSSPPPEVKVVTPSYGDFEEKERIVRNNAPTTESEESVIHDITGTTVYVVGVICIIPAAGLVAWVVRYIVRKKGLPNSENGSETGLNCPISDEDMMQVKSSQQNEHGTSKRKSVCLEEEGEPNPAQENIKEMLSQNVWQISRQNLRLLTVLGEGNFGKVRFIN